MSHLLPRAKPLDEACSQTHVKAGVTPMGTLGAMGESTASEQMSNLLVLLKQQMEWTMRAEECRREQGIGVAEALETRMRQMEVFPTVTPHTLCRW